MLLYVVLLKGAISTKILKHTVEFLPYALLFLKMLQLIVYLPSRKALFLCLFQGGDEECPKISA